MFFFLTGTCLILIFIIGSIILKMTHLNDEIDKLIDKTRDLQKRIKKLESRNFNV